MRRITKSHITPRLSPRAKVKIRNRNSGDSEAVCSVEDTPPPLGPTTDTEYFFVRNKNGEYLEANTHKSEYYAPSGCNPTSRAIGTPRKSSSSSYSNEYLPMVGWSESMIVYPLNQLPIIKSVMRRMGDSPTATLHTVTVTIKTVGEVLTAEEQETAMRDWIAASVTPEQSRVLGLEMERTMFELSELHPLYHARNAATNLTPVFMGAF